MSVVAFVHKLIDESSDALEELSATRTYRIKAESLASEDVIETSIS